MLKTAEERITQSRVRLLLTKPFFGTLATRLRLQEVESIPTAGTDGRHFYFNRAFIDRLDEGELDFLVGHEVLHCVYDHMQARGDRNHVLYNIACDFNINMELVTQNIGTLIGEDKLNGGKPCLDWKYQGKNSYEIYDELFQSAEDGGQDDLAGMDIHFDGEDGDGEGSGYKDGNGNPIKGMSEEEKKALGDEIKQAVINAAQGAGQEVPDTIKRMVAELTAPKLDWTDVLRVSIESSLKNDFTFLRPSKRSGEVIFPGMNKDEMLNIAIALDMSGSIADSVAKEMLSEVQGIMGQYSEYKITVFCFDTGVYNVDTFSSDDGRLITEYDLAGGGGTDFDVVYKYMEQQGLEPDQLIMFTDGYPWGSWGNPDYCDTLFVIHGDAEKRITAPFGMTVHYETSST
jgi:predicted metal-dependent peptidase